MEQMTEENDDWNGFKGWRIKERESQQTQNQMKDIKVSFVAVLGLGGSATLSQTTTQRILMTPEMRIPVKGFCQKSVTLRSCVFIYLLW